MAYYRLEKNGLYSIQFPYDDAHGERRRKRKCGFKTKKEATKYMNEFIKKAKLDTGMTFGSYYEEFVELLYGTLRYSTIQTKEHIIKLHILPYFKDMKLSDITPLDIKKWQNEIIKKGFSPSYLRTINAQLSAMFNVAVKYYDLPKNPCRVAGIMGKSESGNLGIWTQEEMEKFLGVMEDKVEVYYAFFFMYWTGIRLGELLALNIEDIDFDKKAVYISKSLNRMNKKDIISLPKTDAGKRTIYLPQFVLDKMSEYIDMLYGRMGKDRLFVVTKSTLEKSIKRGAELAELKKIRVHDLRHSHASLLISQNVDIATISKRLGHEKIKTTLNIYGHMFDANAKSVADILEEMNCIKED